jgi:hypothetical protein
MTVDPLTGRSEVVTSESGGSQTASWTTWAPACHPAPERKPTITTFSHPGRQEPTREFQALVEDLRKRNDPGPLVRERLKEL